MTAPSVLRGILPALYALSILAILLSIATLGRGTRTFADVPSFSAPVPEADDRAAWPRLLRIERLGLERELLALGRTASGEMETPVHALDVGWYSAGVRPGEPGNAVITGHRDGVGGARGVFRDLWVLQEGDVIEVEDERGSVHRFRVTHKELFAAGEAPLRDIFGPADAPRLNLVTCSGTWDWSELNYDKRLVVFTEKI